MTYAQIDARKLAVFPLADRKSLTRIEDLVAGAEGSLLMSDAAGAVCEPIRKIRERIATGRKTQRGAMLTYGAHLIKNGGGSLLNRLIETGGLTHLATQGAGAIHDWEFAYQGLSTESVRENAPVGRFGSWDETGRWINLAAAVGAAEGLGFGESLGRLIDGEQLVVPGARELEQSIAADPTDPLCAAKADLLGMIRDHGIRCGTIDVPHPFKRFSVLACAYRHRVPLTIHPGIGYDIIINHPMYHGAAIGRSATTDARIFAHSVDRLEGGVYLSVGSAIMSPQVFEKAFSAANNIRVQEGRPFIRGHLIAVIDLQDAGSWDWAEGEPPKDDPAYYLRFCKTFARMAGELVYLQMDNIAFLQALLRS
ncbi:MAG: GSU2086 family protein [Thermoguttaceae bacterium]